MLSSSERTDLRLRTVADNNIPSHFNITFFNSNFTVTVYFWQGILVFHYGDDTVYFSVDLLKKWGNLIFNEYSNYLFFKIYILKISSLQNSPIVNILPCIFFYTCIYLYSSIFVHTQFWFQLLNYLKVSCSCKTCHH